MSILGKLFREFVTPQTKVGDKSTPASPEKVDATVEKNVTASPIHFSIEIDLSEEKSGIDIRPIPRREEMGLKDYYVLDVETTGLDRKRDRIVEIAWVKVEKGKIVDSYFTLVNPEIPISPAASALNGICNEDVANAPTYSEIRGTVRSALMGSTIVGHNVTFDLAFVRNLLGDMESQIMYADTMTIARHAFPGQNSYKLGELCKSLSLSQQSTHRALDDVLTTKELLDKCQDELKRKAEEEKVRKRQKKEQEHRERAEIYGKSPLFDISFVFTGAFTYPREEMMQLAVDAGAFARTSVTRNTDYLVVGYVDNLPDWAIERKIGKANEIISKGGKIKKISESEYIMLIENANRALSR